MSLVHGAQALSRAMQLLKQVAQHPGGATLNTLVTATDLNRTTAYRLLTGLAAEGMVILDPIDVLFKLGPECYALGVAANQYFGINKLAVNAVTRLATKSGDAAFFSVRSDCSSVCVLREDGDHPIKTLSLQPGKRHPLGIGAAGLAMLAALDDDEVDACLFANNEVMRTKYPHITAGTLRLEVAETRKNGYAFNKGKVTAGSWGIGVALADSRQNVVGALSISAVVMRLQADREKEIGALLLREKQLLEAGLRQAETLKKIVFAKR